MGSNPTTDAPGPSLRVIDTGAATPAWNMAFDACLLRSRSAPTLRVYRWSPPGLSIGWFQDPAMFAHVAGPHHVVRRPTGGGAIYHDDELTFSLTADAGLLPGDIPSSYQRIHAAVAKALASVGVETRLLAASSGPQHARPRAPWCFAEAGAFDLVLASTGRKIVGSAQRRIRFPHARLLHHGSIVLCAPEPTPFCAAVAECVDPRTVEARLAAELALELGAALGLVVEPSEATPAELDAAAAAEAGFSTVSVP